ncbi:MAG TPA: methylated-DNA--[protein]-cysteine S-methyltransferase [Nocardioidaceae bacterium]|nr:methylated-DNA--[protein]-cysteine S-methyltransferase [Nocardioidaceae bacterium]
MWTTMESPVGELRIVANQRAITAIEFDGSPDGASPRSSAVRAAAVSAGRPRGDRDDVNSLLAEAVRQLRAYFARELKEFDLPLEPDGTPFQRRVWDELVKIGYGETASYGQIAKALGMTAAASRAVGLANGRNPIPIVVPCHRVVGSDGKLTGYAGGLERKQVLLDLEQDALF